MSFPTASPLPANSDGQEQTLKPALAKSPERQEEFTTLSGVPINRLYTPADLAEFDYSQDLGDPGEYPYTRGIHPTMYRGKIWTMRQFSGFGSPEDTNQRLHYLLKQGQTGLSIAFDLPTLMGYDSDHPAGRGRSGPLRRCRFVPRRYGNPAGGPAPPASDHLHDHQFARRHYLGDVPGGGGEERRGLEEDFRHHAERHPEGIHRAERVHLPARSFHAPGRGYHHLRGARGSALESHLHQRLPHSRSGFDRRAGTGLHPARWNRIRGVGHARRHARG